MDRLNLQTPDLTTENVKRIQQLFPNCVTESEDSEWNIMYKVDFDLLRTELGDESVVEWLDERYRLDWPGKKRSKLDANTPIDKTLRPVKKDSVNWDTTENLYIEWDNFEVLKILQESYLGKIKMIYIDPPYNTGKDFVYSDNFTEDAEDYKERTELNDEWYKMIKNTDTKWRFHSNWLSMMYKRIKVARDLLTPDGCIFISIDDNEVDNLKKICDEIFWEGNYITTLKWKKKKQPSFLSKVAWIIEYILVYSKNESLVEKLSIESLSDSDKPIVNASNNPVERTFYKWIRTKTTEDVEVIKAWIYQNKSMSVEFLDDVHIKDWRTLNDFRAISKFRSTQENLNDFMKKDLIFITKNFWFRRDLSDEEKGKWKAITDLLLDWWQNQDGSDELKSLFGITDEVNIFDNPKPVLLIKNLIKSNCSNDDIVLDFFSWSATTAQSVFEYNSELEENGVKFILVQIPESIENTQRAYEMWYENICELWKERIRRAAKKIKEERGADIDYGFRVFRVDESCLKSVDKHPNEITQWDLFNDISNIREDRTPEDLLTQVILSLWLTLDLPIEERKIKNNRVFYVAWNSLVACFDENIDFSILEEIAKDEPLKLVFRDACFRSDTDRINVENTMKRLSENTIVKVI